MTSFKSSGITAKCNESVQIICWYFTVSFVRDSPVVMTSKYPHPPPHPPSQVKEIIYLYSEPLFCTLAAFSATFRSWLHNSRHLTCEKSEGVNVVRFEQNFMFASRHGQLLLEVLLPYCYGEIWGMYVNIILCVKKQCINNVFQFVFERKYKLLKYLLNNFCWFSFYFSVITAHEKSPLSLSNNNNNNIPRNKELYWGKYLGSFTGHKEI
jgi:hypothetical protein